MKICSTCNKEKPDEQFSWKQKSKGTRASKCKLCHKEYAAGHYKENSDAYKDRANKSRPDLVAKGREYVLEWLRTHPCVDCGNSDIRVLQFDHVEMIGSKARRVSNWKGSFGRLKEEIAKCEVRCANCHMIRTFDQMGWTR